MANPYESYDSADAQKYLLLDVPAWDVNQKMSSYLCLGGANGDPSMSGPMGSPLPGYEAANTLASLVQGFADDDRVRSDPSAPPESRPPDSPDPNPEPTAGTPAATAMRKESAVLHTKGGWRDHSDGNRISTTVGDKVEVIRGNYKLVVLGRNDQLQYATGLDMSGGITDPSTTAAEYATSATKGLDPDFTNSLPNTHNQAILENIWEWSTTDADGKPRWHVTQRTGSATQANAAMTTRTWAYSIDSFIGSQDAPVQEMSDTTYAVSQTSTATIYGDQTSTSTISGDQHTNVTADHVYQTTSYSDEYSNTTTGGAAWSNTRMSGSDMSVINAVLLSIAYADTTMFRTEVDVAALITELNVAAMISEFKIGVHLDMHLGSHIDWHDAEHFDMHIGPHYDMATEKSKVATSATDVSAMWSVVSANATFV